MSKLEELKSQLLPLVQKLACIKLSQPIRLSSGKMSDVYFDGRKVTLHPVAMSLFAKCILEMVDLGRIDAVGGPTLGADPIATAVSMLAYLEKKKELPVFIVRKEAKQHGLQKQIEGIELKNGMKVLIVEDVVTTGSSVKHAIQAVEQTGAKVIQVLCLLDREEGGGENLKPYPLVPVFRRDEIKI